MPSDGASGPVTFVPWTWETHARRRCTGTEPQGLAWVVPAGGFDLDDRDRVEAELEAAGTTPGLQVLLVDLPDLEFIGSTGLNAFVVADARLSSAGRRMVILRRGDGFVARVIETTGLDQHLEWLLDVADLRRPEGEAGPRHLRGGPAVASPRERSG